MLQEKGLRRRPDPSAYGDEYDDAAILDAMKPKMEAAVPGGIPVDDGGRISDNPTAGVTTVGSKPPSGVPRGTGPTNTTLDNPDTGIPNRPSTTATNPGGGTTSTPSTSSRPSSYDYIEGSEGLTFGDKSRMSGFNTNEWGEGGDPNYDEFSYKNSFGKIASRYPPTPDSARQLFNDPDFQRTFPRAQLVDHPTDPKIIFEPGDPPVDVLIASGQGGWGWQPEGEGGGAPGGGAQGDYGGGSGNTSGVVQPTPVPDNLGAGNLTDILALLAAMGRGEDPLTDQALLDQLGGR